MKVEKINNIKLGLFVIVGSLLLISGIYLVGAKQNLFGSTFVISTIFTNAGGLQAGNNVRYAGINVGTINDISIISDSSIRLDLKLMNRARPFIKKNAVASLSIDGIVGSALINITPGVGISEPVEDGDFIKAAHLPGTSDLIATLGSTNENIALFALDLLEISGQIRNGPGMINMVLQDSQVSQNLKSFMNNLELASRHTLVMVQKLEQTVAQLEEQQGFVQQMIHDTIILHNIRKLSISLNETFSGKMDTLVYNLDESAINLSSATSELNRLLGDIQTGDGIINHLLYSEELSQSLQETVLNLQEGTEKFDENMKALQSNFLIRRYFRKQNKAKRVDSLKVDPVQ